MNDIRQIVKLLKVPGASKCRSIDKTFTWNKERGHANRQMGEMTAAAVINGFKVQVRDHVESPDGNNMGSGTVWSDGEWTLTLRSHYGVTAGENWFSATVKKYEMPKEQQIAIMKEAQQNAIDAATCQKCGHIHDGELCPSQY